MGRRCIARQPEKPPGATYAGNPPGSALLADGTGLAGGGSPDCRLFGLSGSMLLRVLGSARCRKAECLAKLVFDFIAYVRMFAQEQSRIFSALAQALTLVGNPRAGFFQHAIRHTEVEQVTFAGNAFAVNDVEFSFPERRSHLVLHDFRAGA